MQPKEQTIDFRGVISPFENVLSDISRLLRHFQLVDDRTRQGREWDCDENLHRHRAVHLAPQAVHTVEIVLQGSTCQTVGAVNSIARHYLNRKIRM